jgi:hypothetical protein
MRTCSGRKTANRFLSVKGTNASSPLTKANTTHAPMQIAMKIMSPRSRKTYLKVVAGGLGGVSARYQQVNTVSVSETANKFVIHFIKWIQIRLNEKVRKKTINLVRTGT